MKSIFYCVMLLLTSQTLPAYIFSDDTLTGRPKPYTNYLDRMTAESDVVFKGLAVSSHAESNACFPEWAKPHITRFHVVSVLKGEIKTNELSFWHFTSGPMAWGGGNPPESHNLETNISYLVFARRLDKPDYLFEVPPDATNRPNEFRQLYSGGIYRTLSGPLPAGLSVSNALWLELNRLLLDENPANQLYAINELDTLSAPTGSGDGWGHGDSFNRLPVWNVILSLIGSTNTEVACRTLKCFHVETTATNNLAPYVDALVKAANQNPTSRCRLEAISALSGLAAESVSNSLAQLVHDSNEDVRLDTVGLLPNFPDAFAEANLRDAANDMSPNVRAAVADVIGDHKYENLLPTLVQLFADPVGKDPLIKSLTMDFLKAGQRWSNGGDVHTSAGMALVKFAPNQVSSILKSNLNDEGFHINFVAKLAQGDPEPWLPELMEILEARRAHVKEIKALKWDDPKRYLDIIDQHVLTGTYTKCWEDIRQYLLKQTPEALASGKYDFYMDELEKTMRSPDESDGVCIMEARWLYQLYWDKGLALRVASLRKKYDKNESWWFDDYNQGIRGNEDPVGAITF